jgi:hypothetical protein
VIETNPLHSEAESEYETALAELEPCFDLDLYLCPAPRRKIGSSFW